jgi:hypothetical protein
VEFEAELADSINQRELDKVVNVFSGWMCTHKGLARFRSVLRGNRIQRGADLRSLTFGEDPCSTQSRSVGLAGGYLLWEKPPIKDDGTLPLFEVRVERLTKAARPHLYGLMFVGH